ncbi:MAG TPA: cytochrome c [Longimicrobiales bacterium]|nr:cytochrome c [Longimicrobiales bacterium]
MSERRSGSRAGSHPPVALHLVVAVLTAGVAACTPFDDAMVAIFGRSMRSQPSLDPYENPVPAPENSVPFAAPNFPAGPDRLNLGQAERGEFPPPFTQADVVQQRPVVVGMENPIPPTAASLERGRELYTRNCAICHGDQGVGAEASIADVHPVLAAFNLSGEVVQGYADGYIYGMIRRGRGLMPSYAHAIGHFDRWHIVNYVRRLQGLVPEGGVAAPAPQGAADEGGRD